MKKTVPPIVRILVQISKNPKSYLLAILLRKPFQSSIFFLSKFLYRGGSSAGATCAWASADIQQRVPGTHPEISLDAKVLIRYQKYQNIKIRFDFLVKIECKLNQIDTFSFEFFFLS